MTDLQRLLKKEENDISEALGLKPRVFFVDFLRILFYCVEARGRVL